MALPTVKLDQGIHVMHLFYKLDRMAWDELTTDESIETRNRLNTLCEANSKACVPFLRSYATVGGKADLCFWLMADELGELAQMHRDLEACFPPGTIDCVYSYLSVTELTEYQPTYDDSKARLIGEGLDPESEEFKTKFEEAKKHVDSYRQFRIRPEMQDWEVMSFYPMNKRRDGADNWYMLEFDARKKLMSGHARVGRKYAGRISQMITGSVGIDDWEWGVTLMAHQVDALKEIVYEMRFDEVSARYGAFGEFYISLRAKPDDLWEHLSL
jgi:hydrogen peroxide-dependent heme synthase